MNIKNLKQRLKIPEIIEALRDVRVVSFLGFGVISLLVAWNIVGVIEKNYELQQQIAQLERENVVQSLRNANQSLRNEYYNSEQYLELQARRQFGLAAEGETVYIIPESVALVNSIEVQERPDAITAQEEKAWYRQNLEEWREFFFRSDNDIGS